MSFVDARAQYRRAEAGVPVMLDNPHQIIQVTLRELEKSLTVLSHAMAQGHPLPDSHISPNRKTIPIPARIRIT